MADPADFADVAIEQHMTLALAARPPARPGQCSLECESCGYPIAEERRLAMLDRGCTRCAECQGLHEQRGGL